MHDVTVELENRPGALAEMGEALARASISIEGGGAFALDGRGVVHLLFEDGDAARKALEAAGIKVVAVSGVLVQRLNQEEPGQLGKLTRRMADSGVNILTLYSDHNHRMILTVDNYERGSAVSRAWEEERLAKQSKESR